MDETLPTVDGHPLPHTKAELLERIEQGWAALAELVGQLSDARLSQPAGADGWSVKDHLAHLTAWEAGIAALLRHQPRYGGMGFAGDSWQNREMDDLNQLIYERNRDRPATEVLADWRSAHQDLLAVLRSLEDADLRQPYSHYQPDEPGEDSGDPIVDWIVGNTYEHYAEHHGWIEQRLKEQQPPGSS